MKSDESESPFEISINNLKSEAKASSAKFSNDLLKLSFAGIIVLSLIISATVFLGSSPSYKNLTAVIVFFVLAYVSFWISICLSTIRHFAAAAEALTSLKYVQMRRSVSDKNAVDAISRRTGYNNFAYIYFHEKTYAEDDPQIEFKKAADQRDVARYLKETLHNLLMFSAVLFCVGALMISISIISLLLYVVG